MEPNSLESWAMVITCDCWMLLGELCFCFDSTLLQAWAIRVLSRNSSWKLLLIELQNFPFRSIRIRHTQTQKANKWLIHCWVTRFCKGKSHLVLSLYCFPWRVLGVRHLVLLLTWRCALNMNELFFSHGLMALLPSKAPGMHGYVYFHCFHLLSHAVCLVLVRALDFLLVCSDSLAGWDALFLAPDLLDSRPFWFLWLLLCWHLLCIVAGILLGFLLCWFLHVLYILPIGAACSELDSGVCYSLAVPQTMYHGLCKYQEHV